MNLDARNCKELNSLQQNFKWDFIELLIFLIDSKFNAMGLGTLWIPLLRVKAPKTKLPFMVFEGVKSILKDIFSPVFVNLNILGTTDTFTPVGCSSCET